MVTATTRAKSKPRAARQNTVAEKWAQLRENVRERIKVQHEEAVLISRNLRESLETRRDEAKAIWWQEKYIVRFSAVVIFFAVREGFNRISVDTNKLYIVLCGLLFKHGALCRRARRAV